MIIDVHSDTAKFARISEARMHDKKFLKHRSLPEKGMIAQLLLMVLKARTKTKKAFSIVAALICIHLVSNLNIYWLIENCSRTYVRKRKRNKNSAIQLSLEL
ncbi:MAG: hypothetical protein GXZ19_00465 [Bacteroidales bacterium]|jgi:hypothetical protein|nr:hypothetical protein [Bacteroidales bacterium]